jgi:predicted N-acyltransferase
MDLESYLSRLQRAREDLELRQRPSRFSFALSDSIAFVRPADWNHVVTPDHVWLRPEYLEGLEAAQPPGMSFRYAMVYAGRRPVAAAALQLFDVSLEDVGARQGRKPDDSLRGRMEALARRVGDAMGPAAGARLLVAGNAWASGEHAIAIAADVAPAEVMHALADATYRIRRAEKLHGTVASVLVKDFYAPRQSEAAELERFGYHRFEVDPNMIVAIDPAWETFDGYLKAMTSKYRKRAKDARKQGASVQRRRLGPDEVAARSEELYALYLAVHERAFFRIADPGPGYLPHLAERLHDRAHVDVYEVDGSCIGFRFALAAGPDLEAHMVGLDYAVNERFALYQNMLYDFVEAAIEAKCRRIVMGRTALEMKSAIGAHAAPMACWMRHSNPVGNRLIAPLVAQLEPSQWTQRSPFKES